MRPRILVAGIGNIFFGDDAFGVEAARRLALESWPEGVRVVDFGIRGLDLAYALLEPYELAILVDAAPQGGAPGTLYVIEPDAAGPTAGEPTACTVEMHGMNPWKVLQMATALGGPLPRVLVVGCEPTPLADPDDMQMGLSQPVQAALDEAVRIVQSLVAAHQSPAAAIPAATSH
ncbi:MAG TPA: hydrogenase maturation protease [Pirellulales bacterium]|jgi:hydrogenase maturation protease|nr:hydrogenase maturation protease [Pirellulales bacterium]